MPEPCSIDEVAALLHRELAPVRAEIAGLRSSIEGDDGLRVRVAVQTARISALETAVRQQTPPEPPDRRPPDPPPAALPPKRRDDSDEGTTLSLLTLRGKGWPGLLGRLLGLLIPGSLVAGGGYWAGQSSAPTPHPAPPAASAPPPPSGAPEPTP